MMTNMALRPSSCFSTTEHKSLEVVEKKNSQLKIIIEKLNVSQPIIILLNISIFKNDKNTNTKMDTTRQNSSFFSPLTFAINDNSFCCFFMIVILQLLSVLVLLRVFIVLNSVLPISVKTELVKRQHEVQQGRSHY